MNMTFRFTDVFSKSPSVPMIFISLFVLLLVLLSMMISPYAALRASVLLSTE